jgi:hypothetical protein
MRLFMEQYQNTEFAYFQSNPTSSDRIVKRSRMGKYGYPRMPDCLQSVHKDIAALVNENNYNTTRNARHRNSADVLPNNQ